MRIKPFHHCGIFQGKTAEPLGIVQKYFADGHSVYRLAPHCQPAHHSFFSPTSFFLWIDGPYIRSICSVLHPCARACSRETSIPSS
jgi:hypothetical protein